MSSHTKLVEWIRAKGLNVHMPKSIICPSDDDDDAYDWWRAWEDKNIHEVPKEMWDYVRCSCTGWDFDSDPAYIESQNFKTDWTSSRGFHIKPRRNHFGGLVWVCTICNDVVEGHVLDSVDSIYPEERIYVGDGGIAKFSCRRCKHTAERPEQIMVTICHGELPL